MGKREEERASSFSFNHFTLSEANPSPFPDAKGIL